MTEQDGEILTLEEVAAYLKAGKRTVYRLAKNGEIPAFKLGGTWRVGADPNLSHRADRILSQGWRPVLS